MWLLQSTTSCQAYLRQIYNPLVYGDSCWRAFTCETPLPCEVRCCLPGPAPPGTNVTICFQSCRRENEKYFGVQVWSHSHKYMWSVKFLYYTELPGRRLGSMAGCCLHFVNIKERWRFALTLPCIRFYFRCVKGFVMRNRYQWQWQFNIIINLFVHVVHVCKHNRNLHQKLGCPRWNIDVLKMSPVASRSLQLYSLFYSWILLL